MKYVICKFLFFAFLKLPDSFFKALFNIVFPIYKALHKKRAYGRVEKHLAAASLYIKEKRAETEAFSKELPVEAICAQQVFKGIFWNAIDSYRGLARLPRTTEHLIFENESIIREALAKGPVAAISIHQGAFEILHRSLCRYSSNVHLVTDTLKNGELRRIIQELRSDKNLTEYAPDETRKLVRNLFHTKEVSNIIHEENLSDSLSKNGILAMVVDQGKHTKGNSVTLFGQKSTLYLRLPQLVNQMGAGIVTFRTWGETGFDESGKKVRKNIIRFESYYAPSYDANSSNNCDVESRKNKSEGREIKGRAEGKIKGRDEGKIKGAPGPNFGEGLTDCIASEIEMWIAEHPEQWSWNYHGNFK